MDEDYFREAVEALREAERIESRWPSEERRKRSFGAPHGAYGVSHTMEVL
jgi:hypothetical protein